jgi:hypothetical protein
MIYLRKNAGISPARGLRRSLLERLPIRPLLHDSHPAFRVIEGGEPALPVHIVGRAGVRRQSFFQENISPGPERKNPDPVFAGKTGSGFIMKNDP